MDNIEIIKEIESSLPLKYQNATIFVNNEYIPLFTFLETKFINCIKPGAKVDNLVSYIENVLGKLIKIENKAEKLVDEFINNNTLYKDVIQLNKKEVISAREYLIDYLSKNLNDDGTIKYIGDTLITIEELYIKLLNQEYKEPTLEEKTELCVDMLRYIDKEILDSIVDGMDLSVKDYITNVLPSKMTSATQVLVDNEEIEINDLIVKIVDHQREMLVLEEQKKKEEKENLYNKTSDNPNLVSEIQIKLNETNNNLEVTAEIPTVTSSLLNEEETTSLLNNYKKKEKYSDEDYYMSEFNKLKEAIDNSKTENDLKVKENRFIELKEEAIKKELPNNVNVIISSIESLIIKKRNNLIKVVSNQEEYIDALFSEINRIDDKIDSSATMDEFSILYGEAIQIRKEIENKKISDYQLKASALKLIGKITKERIIMESITGNKSREAENIKDELDGLIRDIKQDILTIKHDSNNLGGIAGTEIRLNSNIQSAKEAVEQAYLDKYLTEDTKEYYMNQIKGYSCAIQSDAQIGYGTR